MYRMNDVDSTRFISNMEAIKRENQEYKKLIASREYKSGRYISEFCQAFKTEESFKSYWQGVKGKLQWRRLCRRFPIIHPEERYQDYECNYFSDEEIVVYTSIFGKYDVPQEPVFRPDNCRFIIFTDQEIDSSSAWEKIELPSEFLDDTYTNAEKNRICKMLPHVLFPQYRHSVYIDGNIKPVSDLTEFVNKCGQYGMAFHMHKARNCVYDEIEACKILGKAPEKDLTEYQAFLKKNGFPKKYGMNECNVIVRDHQNSTVCQIMSEWWDMFKNGNVKRDQLSFPFLLYKYGIKPINIGTLGGNVQDNPAIRVTLHR